jgi:glutamate N-acetyltransferase/amino-acid N-acetyltransferase
LKFIEGGITAPEGFMAAVARAGLRRASRKDIAVIYSQKECNAAAAFTTNRLRAACIEVTEKHLRASGGRLNCIVVNSGNANALTGKEGIRNAERMCAEAARLLGIRREMVAVASTGIIGVQLPIEKVLKGLRDAIPRLSDSTIAGTQAAEAIMTTDRVRKECAIETELHDGRKIKLGGMTKGSGMIAPRMRGLHATTLTFITTDAPVQRTYLQHCLDMCVEDTFNLISIDGDMSTNDCIILAANGAALGPTIRKDTEFEEALHAMLASLAKKVAMDGEGETKLIVVEVRNAKSNEDARNAALSVVNSNLVKCAIFGSDPNIGRIAAALGASGCSVNFSCVDISLCGEKVVSGGIVEMDRQKVVKKMRAREILIEVDLHAGKYSATAMGSDLSYDYIRINSAYST